MKDAPQPEADDRRRQVGDLIFHNVTRAFAVLTLVTLFGIIVSLVVGCLAVDREVRRFVPLVDATGTRPRTSFGALIPDLRHPGHLGDRAASSPCRSASASRFSSPSCRPLWLRRPLGDRDRACSPPYRASSTACGGCSFSRRSSGSTCSPRSRRRWASCRSSARCSAERRSGIGPALCGRHHSGDHDHSRSLPRSCATSSK